MNNDCELKIIEAGCALDRHTQAYVLVLRLKSVKSCMEQRGVIPLMHAAILACVFFSSARTRWKNTSASEDWGSSHLSYCKHCKHLHGTNRCPMSISDEELSFGYERMQLSASADHTFSCESCRSHFFTMNVTSWILGPALMGNEVHTVSEAHLSPCMGWVEITNMNQKVNIYAVTHPTSTKEAYISPQCHVSLPVGVPPQQMGRVNNAFGFGGWPGRHNC